MPLLVPGIGKVDAHLGQRGVGDITLQHLDRIVVVDAHVGRAVIRQRVEQAADAGAVHLDADEVALRLVARGKAQRLAVAEADFQHPLGGATERGIEIARRAGRLQPVARPVFGKGTLLRRGQPALAQHVAADRARGGRGFLGRGSHAAIIALFAAAAQRHDAMS